MFCFCLYEDWHCPCVWLFDAAYPTHLVRFLFQTDIVFLEREIKTRKQSFGIEIYDMMEQLEANDALSVTEKEAKIRALFDGARKDIAVIQAKKECKKEEILVLEAETDSDLVASIPPSSGAVLTNDAGAK